MTRFTILDRHAHASLRVADHLDESSGAGVHMVPVVTREVPRLLAHYPLFLIRFEDTGGYGLVALLGFGTDENLFLTEAGWSEGYVPLEFQRGPFQVAIKGQGQDGVLQIDLDDARVQDGAGEGHSLFETDGSPSAYLAQINTVLATLMTGADETREFCTAIVDAGLVEPVNLSITFKSGEHLRFDRLHTINREALTALRGAPLEALQAAGHLRTCFEVAASLAQIQPLIARKDARDLTNGASA